MSYFTFDRKRVYYNIKGEGQPLLLLPGNTASSRMFSSVLKMYVRHYKVILIDFPGHGRSERLPEFETDFWWYNSQACYALLEELKLDKIAVIGTSGGAIVGLNLALEYPERVSFLIADSFEGEYPLASYMEILESDREQSKKSCGGKMFYFMNHRHGWRKVVDADTKALMDFYRTGKSFYHKPIGPISVPTLLTGSRSDEFCDHLEEIYKGLQKKNDCLRIHMFDKGSHPAMLSNKEEFFALVKNNI